MRSPAPSASDLSDTDAVARARNGDHEAFRVLVERYQGRAYRLAVRILVDPDQAVIWRGPMLHKALEQFLGDVFWDDPDFLLLDMPPGTGDVSISISQFVPRARSILVTTPQATRCSCRCGRAPTPECRRWSPIPEARPQRRSGRSPPGWPPACPRCGRTRNW